MAKSLPMLEKTISFINSSSRRDWNMRALLVTPVENENLASLLRLLTILSSKRTLIEALGK